MIDPTDEARFLEADRRVDEAMARAAALVRAKLGPGPAERERYSEPKPSPDRVSTEAPE